MTQRASDVQGWIDPANWIRDPTTGQSLPPRQQPGYYRGFSTLGQSAYWDDATRKVVTRRVTEQHPRRFFTEAQWDFWLCVFDHLIPQTDRQEDRRIPILPALDKRLFENHTAGYRYEDMPPDREAYLLGIVAIDAEAEERFGGKFISLSAHQQELILQAIHDGRPQAASDIWTSMNVHRFWQLLMGDAIEAYYSHPWAWDEIGFGGPAYPRAYTRLEGEPEPWEVREQRYEWLAPSFAVSDQTDAMHEHSTEALQQTSRGKRGTS